jgi:hypothetical protein
MPYSITTKDGITIPDIPDDVAPDAPELKAMVERIRAGQKPVEKPMASNQPELSAADVAVSAVKNFPSSVGSMLGDIYQAVSSPVQTTKAVLDLGAGILQNVLPEKLVQLIGEDRPSREVANKVGQHYVQRYGSVEGAKRAFATDPAGVMADLSTVLTAGATLPTRAAPALATAARTVDPLMLAARTTGKTLDVLGAGTKFGLGMQTGVGSEAIGQAYQAGKTGGEMSDLFKANLRGEVPQLEVLDAAKQNLAKMATERRRIYNEGMKNIKGDATVLSFKGIDDAVKQALDDISFKGQIKNEVAFDKLTEAQTKVNNWKNLDPAQFHTPEGLDALKQQIGDILEKIPYEQKTALGSVNQVYNGIKSEIVKQAPTYSKTMKAYSDATDTIREIEKALSLNNKATADTAMRKLQSLMRNNVNTNYGQRLNLAKELEQAGGRQMMPALAGQALSEFTPRGLQRATSIPTAFLAQGVGGLPLAAASLVTSSPRLMGEAAYGAGRVSKGLLDVQNRLPDIDYPTMFNLLYQAEQPTKIDLTGMANPN